MRIRIFFSASMALLMTAAGSTAVYAQGVVGQGTWESTLLGRDINVNAVAATSVDAVYLYDTTLNVTWLRNANVAGPMDWNTAVAWASNLVTGSGANAISDWRLPTMADPAADCNFSYGGTNCGYNVATSAGEIASLFFSTLGNRSQFDTSGNYQTPYGLTNIGSFQNMNNRQACCYWLGTEYAPIANAAFYFDRSGFQSAYYKDFQMDAMAVRSGDVGSVVSAVPEPQTYAMLLFGLGLIGAVARRRQSDNASRGTV